MIQQFKVHIPATIDAPLLEVLHSGYIGQGKKVEEFEKLLSEYFKNPYVLTLNAGTSGLHLALRLSNIRPGDEVITTAMTCTATNMPILACGAKIVWADVDPRTGLIYTDSIREKITKKTKAIMMVHFGGIPCDVVAINNLAKEYNIKTIEDAAHAFGATVNEKKIGNYSDYTMFSLQAIKHITTIDGGLLLCKNDEDYKRGKLLRWYGIDRESSKVAFRCEDDIKEYGYKFHMNDINATVGIEQMKYVEKIIEQHKKNEDFYDEELKGIKGIKLIPKEIKKGSAAWLYTLHIEQRDLFINWMHEHEVQVSRVHERNDKHTAFKDSMSSLPGLDEFNSTQVSIPVGWWLTNSERIEIVELIKEFSKEYL